MGRSPSSVVGMAVTGQGLAPRAVPNLLLAWPRGSKGPVWARVWLEKVQGLLTAGGVVVTAATTKPLPQAAGMGSTASPEKLLLGRSDSFCCCCSHFNLLAVPRAPRHSQSLATSPALAAKSRAAWPRPHGGAEALLRGM